MRLTSLEGGGANNSSTRRFRAIVKGMVPRIAPKNAATGKDTVHSPVSGGYSIPRAFDNIIDFIGGKDSAVRFGVCERTARSKAEHKLRICPLDT